MSKLITLGSVSRETRNTQPASFVQDSTSKLGSCLDTTNGKRVAVFIPGAQPIDQNRYVDCHL